VPGEHDDRRAHAGLAQKLHRFAPVHVRQPDIHDHQVEMALAGCLDPGAGGGGVRKLEFVIERQLVDQGLAQIGIVVDEQDLAGCHS
jgi:hypothetical protein